MARFDHNRKVSAALPANLQGRLEQVVQELAISRSAVVRLALAEYLESNPKRVLRLTMAEAARADGQADVREEVSSG